MIRYVKGFRFSQALQGYIMACTPQGVGTMGPFIKGVLRVQPGLER